METWSRIKLIQYDIDIKHTIYIRNQVFNPSGRLVFEHVVNYDARYDMGTEIHDEAEYARFQQLEAAGSVTVEDRGEEREPI